ncbi:hypothetical protein LJR034_005233 [Caballeronia sp. LjRoot34]
MKSLINAVAVAAALVVPTVTFAQASLPATRAEARVSSQNAPNAAAKPDASATGVGGVVSGTYSSGKNALPKPIADVDFVPDHH